MWSEFQYVKLPIILDRILKHPLLSDVSMEAAIQYTIDFISIVGLPKVYKEDIEIIEIDNYRGLLPCNCIAINQVRDCKSNTYLRSMTDNFNGNNNIGELTFKTQGRVIFTSFKEGKIELSYKSIPVDDEGLPMIPDNPIFLKALELYIKKEWFTILFDMGKITPAVLQNTQQEYSFKAGQLNNEFTIPSVSEMESITRMWNTLIPRVRDFDNGFKHEGNREFIRLH